MDPERQSRGIPLPCQTPVSSRDAERWDSQGGDGSGSAQLGDAKTPGDPQGALRVRIYCSELRARLGLRTAPLLS